MSVSVHAIFRGNRVALSAATTLTSPVTLPAEYLTFEVEASAFLPTEVLLDKRPTALALTPGDQRGHFLLDAFRSVGFHCLEIAGERFYFATEDAKLKLAGILELLH